MWSDEEMSETYGPEDNPKVPSAKKETSESKTVRKFSQSRFVLLLVIAF